jgi:lipopolysaccharide/colanic/teichoic acid biosynthesis glycosyltransferase
MGLYNICKRGLDIFISLLAVAILSPALAVIVIAIRLGSKRPANMAG